MSSITFDPPDDHAGADRWRLRVGDAVVAEGERDHWADEAVRRALERVRERLRSGEP